MLQSSKIAVGPPHRPAPYLSRSLGARLPMVTIFPRGKFNPTSIENHAESHHLILFSMPQSPVPPPPAPYRPRPSAASAVLGLLPSLRRHVLLSRSRRPMLSSSNGSQELLACATHDRLNHHALHSAISERTPKLPSTANATCKLLPSLRRRQLRRPSAVSAVPSLRRHRRHAL